MKILMISNMLFPMGGVETYMMSISEELKRLGHEVEFFGMEDKRNTLTNKFGIYKRNIDYKKLSIKTLTYPMSVIYSFNSRRKLKKLLKLYKPDIIHLNTINFNITPSIISLISKFRIPIIKTIHDAQIACPNHRLFIEHKMEPCTRCIHGNYTNCFKNKCISNSRSKSLIATIESYFYHIKKTYLKIDKYILPSKFMLNIHLTNGIPSSKMEYLINFSRLNIPSDYPYKGDYVIYFGRISAEKGIGTLIKAIKELKEIMFYFVGTGPMSSDLESIDNVKLLGYKQGDELTTLISRAKLSVYPSEWYENSPLSVLESQALGTPVIAANIGGIPELITEKTGLLFKSGDYVDLKTKINLLFNDEKLLDDMTHACKNNNFVLGVEQYSAKLIEIYKNMIEEKRIKK